MVLVDPYFASKSSEHDITMSSFPANLWEVRNFYLHIGCNIDGPNDAASFALIAPLCLIDIRENARELKKTPVRCGLKGTPHFF